MRGVGFGLSLRLAEQQQRAARRSLAVEQRKAERRRMRRDTAQRRRREAAEAESEAERSDGRLGPRRRLVAPDYSPPMPSSFEPFAQIGRKLSLGRIRERDAAIQGVASEGHGLGFVHALKRVTSRSHVRSASATSTAEVTGAPGYPSTPRTVRGQAIRHMHRSSSVDSLYARTQATAPAVPQLPHITNSATLHSLAAAVEQVTTQYGEALTLPGDQPSQPAGEMRRPSVMAQNAFLSLPPHLHHLLRSPERTRYMPARPSVGTDWRRCVGAAFARVNARLDRISRTPQPRPRGAAPRDGKLAGQVARGLARGSSGAARVARSRVIAAANLADLAACFVALSSRPRS